MSRHTWLAARALLAVVLMISFYALALAVAFGLLWLAYLDIARAGHPSFRLVAFCIAGAASVLWAIVPRPDRFEPPGPCLTAADQPDLFRMVHDIARATSQSMPHDVYLSNDVNAFVAQRGGTMGFGSTRVMGLGLPLMQTLTVDEFRGVLAHEFGHYHAGDVALGPWIHNTRVVMIRTILQLSDSALRFIFTGYAWLFFRITHAVSRRQEFIADEVAARVVGSGAMISSLRKLPAATFAYQNFWYSELVPIIRAGYRPPVTAGFGRYAARPELARLIDGITQQAQLEAKTDPYDTHPSLRDRVAALERQPSRPLADDRPAVSLLRNVGDCERQLFGTLGVDFANLRPIDWPQVAGDVYMPMWRARIQQHGSLLRTYTCGTPPTTEQELKTIGSRIVTADAGDPVRIGAAWQLIVAAYAMALLPLGWSAETLPGEEAVFRLGANELRPFSGLQSIVSGRTTAAAWRQRCHTLGIDILPLGTAASIEASDTHGHLRSV